MTEKPGKKQSENETNRRCSSAEAPLSNKRSTILLKKQKVCYFKQACSVKSTFLLKRSIILYIAPSVAKVSGYWPGVYACERVYI